MIISNLLKILKDRGYTISKVSEETGISRTTLTSLCHNTGNGVQFDTLDTLCSYLKITPTELFTYYPFNFTFEWLSTTEISEFTKLGRLTILSRTNSNRKVENSFNLLIDATFPKSGMPSLTIEFEEPNDAYTYQRLIDTYADNAINFLVDTLSERIGTDMTELFLDSNGTSIFMMDNSILQKWDKWDMYENLKGLITKK
ncbi:helix-turn-helix domain-containing protein [Veillonella seminalis]|uniref:helix-turn-helix domain-containing protein n=1 Tax=Veillonella seminalis TaxID=1502943 RepID=UPI0023F305B4|nr:helix-turn-helix transcriptional regulator [Veillonella seminalis]